MTVNIKEHERRRKALMRMMVPNSIAVIPATPEKTRNRDVEYPYRQDSDLLYLTGFPEPEAVAVLIPGRKQGQYILFCRESDTEKETWYGRRAGQNGALEQYKADDAFPISDIDEILPGLLEDRASVYYPMGRDPEFDHRLMAWVNQLRGRIRAGCRPPHEFITLDYLLHDLRLFKSRSEIATMKKAVKTSVAAHKRAMRMCRPGKSEYEIEAEILHEFRCAAMEPAYPSIVGGGANSCILHYTENSSSLNDGELLLIDAGAECQGYAADITRTFPVNGRFSDVQRDVYETVLEAQQAAIDKAIPGNHWDDPHDAAVKVLTKGLVRLGLLKGRPSKLIKDAKYRRFYMHRTGHWLGLDVHDVGDYRLGDEWRLLEPGMTLTVEPGIYIPQGSKRVAKRWWNIGIRIEDDVLITRDGNQVLTAALPKDPEGIEKLVGSDV